MMNTENTALQMIAEAARCPDYGPDMVKALMEKAGYERERLCTSDERRPFHGSALDQRCSAAMRNSKAAHADLRDRAGDRRQDCRRAAAGRWEESINGTGHYER